MWQHKAFQYWAPAGLLAIPSSNYNYNNGDYRYLSKLELISVDPTNGTLSLHGEIDHSNYYNESPGYWYVHRYPSLGVHGRLRLRDQRQGDHRSSHCGSRKG